MKKGELSTKQKAALAALLAGASHQAAARAASVHPNRIALWLREPAFLEALRAAEGQRMQMVTMALARLAEKAATVLEEVMDNPEARESSRIRAADIVLSRLLEVKELIELEERVQALEKERTTQ